MGKWRMINVPSNPGITFQYGSRDVAQPPDAIMTITRFERMTKWRTRVNNLLALAVMRQMSKKSGLLYAELSGNSQEHSGYTMSIWQAKDMVPFRDSGSHKVAMKYFRWVFGGGAQFYSLTWKLEGPIPTSIEARDIVRECGRHYDNNRLVRKATRPVWQKESAQEAGDRELKNEGLPR